MMRTRSPGLAFFPRSTVYVSLLLISLTFLSSCYEEVTTHRLYAAEGHVYEIIYTYQNGACVGWESQGNYGEDCSDAVGELKTIGAIPGSASPVSGVTFRPLAAVHPQGVLLVGDAFTAID